MARAGLASKGIVYILLGALAFMAAFELGRQSGSEVTRSGMFSFVAELPAGKILLILLVAGLACYAFWRFAVALWPYREEQRKTGRRLRYGASGLAYLSLALTGVRVLLHQGSSGDGNQQMAGDILQKPAGQWLLGLGALIFAGNGIYQIWYGWKGKYRKHLDTLNQTGQNAAWLNRLGVVGYVARGIVWLVLAWMLVNAALHANAREAGDTGKAFSFLEDMQMGSWILGGVGLGLVAYGLFNLARAKWEDVGH